MNSGTTHTHTATHSTTSSNTSNTTTSSSSITLHQQACSRLFPNNDAMTQYKVMSSIYTLTDAALAEGVRSVGFSASNTASASASSNAKSEAMFRLLHSVYDKNLDKMEIYCTRNVFAMEKNVMKRILGLQHRNNAASDSLMDDEKVFEETKEIDEENNDSNPDSTGLDYTAAVDKSIQVVTQNDIDELEKELKELRASFMRQRRRRDVVKHQLETVQRVAAQSGTCVNDLKAAISKTGGSSKAEGDESRNNLSNEDKLYETVSAVMMGKDVLVQVRDDGLQLLRKMNDMNGSEDDADNSFDSISNDRLSFFSVNPNASLEDGFAAFRKQFKTNSTSDVNDLLKKLNG